MKVVIGLGNFGDKYDRTFHNMGFMAVDRVAAELGIEIRRHKCSSLVGDGSAGGEKFLLVKPQTYMNNSGAAAEAICDYYDVEPKNVLVLTDDLDLPKGKVRYRPSGSGGTHNGMRDIVARIGEGFPRVRIGIGGRNEFIPLVNYVLMRPSPEEFDLIDPALELAKRKAIDFLEGRPL